METPRIELENYLVTFFGNTDAVSNLLKYTKYRLVKTKSNLQMNIFYAKIKGKGQKWIESTFTEEELKGVRDAVLIHDVPFSTDYLVVYDPKKPVEKEEKRFILTYINPNYDPYFLDNIQYLTRHVLRLFAVYNFTQQINPNFTQQINPKEILEKNKDEFAKRLVIRIDDKCIVDAISPIVTAVIYYGYKYVDYGHKEVEVMCLFFDVL